MNTEKTLKNHKSQPSCLGAVNGSYKYDIFYDIHGDMATATVRGKNIDDAKRVFKKIYGGWKITNVQRLK
jgi:hypothetical protein